MANASEFITNQFKKAGVEIPATLAEILKEESLTKVNIDDTLVTDVNNKLMTIDAAKQNLVLKGYFKSESLDPLDRLFNETLVQEYGVSEDMVNTIRNEKSTYEKPGLLLKAIKSAYEEKLKADKGDKSTYTQKIDALNAEILDWKNKIKTETEKLQSENRTNELNWNIRGAFAGYDYSDQYNKADLMDLAPIKLQRQLNADNAKIILTPEGLKLVQANDEKLEYYRENQKVAFKDYIDKLVSDNKWIKTTDKNQQQATQNQNQNNQNNNFQQNNQNNGYKVPVKAMNDLDQALKDVGIMNDNGQVKV